MALAQLLITADAEAVRFSDEVIDALPLPRSGVAVDDPATGEVIAHVRDCDAAEILQAVAAADAAGTAWAQRTPRDRSNVLHAWWELLVEHSEQLAHLISREMGKTLAEARGEVAYGSDFVRWYSEEAVRPSGDYRELPGGGATAVVRRSPVGLAVLITPWNFPLAMATRKIAPALAAGCPVVIKPAELTPLTTIYAVELARRAGVPEDLIQVATTADPSRFSETTLNDPRVRKVSFTGSTKVGRHLLAMASERVLRSSMELGGNGAALVFDDADLERAVEGVFLAKMRNGGQSCVAVNRIYVQDGIADEFVSALTERMAQIVVGHGLAPGATLGALVDGRAVTKMHGFVEDAVANGAELLTGGTGYDSVGHFFAPTVLDRVPPTAELASAEIFGPIAAIQRFSNEQGAIAAANATDYGLAGFVFTESLDRAFNVADRLETGMVGINQGVPGNAAAPFGGVKQSGIGREGGAEGIAEFQNVRFYNFARRQTH